MPRRVDARTVAALGAAVLIALQLIATHWFYLYIVWFVPFVLVALFAEHRGQPAAPARHRARAGARSRVRRDTLGGTRAARRRLGPDPVGGALVGRARQRPLFITIFAERCWTVVWLTGTSSSSTRRWPHR